MGEFVNNLIKLTLTLNLLNYPMGDILVYVLFLVKCFDI